jgi:ABC-type molybdate transport system substrate-binding protein
VPVAQGTADLFLIFCTNALMAAQEQPGLQVRRLPENININISASYGITLLNGAPPAARRFVDFVPSLDSQAVLARHGLAPR